MTDHITRLKEALEAYERWMSAGCPMDGGLYDIYPDSFYEAATRPAAIRELLERLEQAEKDARRYRVIRNREHGFVLEQDRPGWRDTIPWMQGTDAAIDAAIASQEGGTDG